MIRRPVSRRGFLRGMAQAGAALPLSALLHRSALAAEGGGVPRALFVFIPDGCAPELWHPSGDTYNFTLPRMTDPLESVRQHCVFLSGLNMYSGGSTHEGGVAKVLTATGYISMDVFIGQYFKDQTPHASIHLGVASNHQNGSGYMSYLGSGQPISPEDNPLSAYERMFGPPGGVEDIENRRKLSVLDAAMGDLNTLQTRLGQAQRQKLELHMESLREVENRILAADQAGAGACSQPDWNREGWAIPEGYNSYPKYHDRDDQFATVGKLQMDLAVQALSCDMTRSLSLQWSHPVSPTHLQPETGASQRHHDSSHFDASNLASAENFVLYKRWFTEQFAYLLRELDAQPEGDGTLLDNTVIFLCSELGHSSRHDHRNMPFVLAGRAGGLETGRALDYSSAHNGDGETHAKLLVSIANAVGIPINSFGYTGHGDGPLQGLYA